MLNIHKVKKFCKDYTQIENYDDAVSDTTQTWSCHHILGEILTKQQLLDHDFYYDVPPCMLKFMTKAEHISLHKKGRSLSKEHRRKLSVSLKGRASPMKGKCASEETRKKLSEAHKGRIPWNKGKHLLSNE